MNGLMQSIKFILFSLIVTLLPLPLVYGQSQGPVVIDFDNPNFRKLLVAIPQFRHEPGSAFSKEAQEGAQQLGELLKFSGLFNVMSEEAYKEVMQKAANTGLGAGSTAEDSLSGIDMVQWKALGVECLVLGDLKQGEKGPVLEIRAIDINQGKALVGKRFIGTDKEWLVQSMRSFGDRILEAYTGKSGIFNSKLVFVGQKTKKSPRQVYMSDFDGSNLKPIAVDNVPHLSPTFSRDGQHIVYTSYRDGNPDLYYYEIASGRTRKFAFDKGLNSGATFAPNDKLVAYAGSVDGNTEIFLMPVSGGKRKMLITGSGLDVSPTFSPDGKSLAFVSGRYERPHIFVGKLDWADDYNPKVVSETRITYAGWYNATPAWSPDSQKLAFAGYDRDIDRFDLFLVNPDGSRLERLTLRVGDNEHPAWSPNGYLIMFSSNRTGESNVKNVHHLHVMNRDGSNQRRINIDLYSAMNGAWGPNLQ